MASPIRDLWLGRLKLVTYENSFQEAVGDELILAGGVAALGARKPKRYAMSLPVHGTQGDPDMYAAGQRLRRQVRSLLENAQARSQGFYMQAFLDPEQNGWLVIGSGTVQYADGGVTLANYTLVLDEVYRVASSRVYRPARRLDIYDRRLSTTPRDFLGSRYATDFAFLTGGVYASASSFAWLPPGVTDASGLARQFVATSPVFSREGAIAAVIGQSSGSVVSFEQVESKRISSDVVIHDRRGQGNWAPPYTNLATNPSFESGTAAWDTTTNSNPGATLSTVTASPLTGAAAMQVTTTAAFAFQGANTLIPLVSGQTFTASVYLKGNAGGESLQLIFGSGASGQVVSTVTLTTSYQRFPVTLASGATGSFPLTLRTSAASALTFFVDGVQVTQTASAVPYFDGSSPGCAWTGVPHASTSVGPSGWVNPITNPRFGNGTTGWTWSASLTVTPAADSPLPPGACADVVGTGATTSIMYPASITNDWLVTAPGQQVYGEAWLKLVTALPAGATLSVTVAWGTPLGGTGTTATLATLTSSSPVGTWIRLSGTAAVPGGATLATIQFSGSANPMHYRVSNSVITDATALGIPPQYNPPGYTNTAYFDGDSAAATWMGTAHASQSVQWLDPQVQPGWEEVYGAEHVLTAGDVPVVSNGLCRVRAERGAAVGNSAYFSFAVDQAIGPNGKGGGGWEEMGRWAFYCDSSGANRPSWAQLAGVSVTEWTAERAVIRASFTGLTGPRRVDVYVTLQRGWSGPRFEVYDFPAAGVTASGYGTTWEASIPNVHVAAGGAIPQGASPVGCGTSSLSGDGILAVGTAGVREPYIALHPFGAYLTPVTYFLRERDDPSLRWAVYASTPQAYASGTHNALYIVRGTTLTYMSDQIAFGAAGAVLEAEAGSLSLATAVTDPGAINPPASAPSLSTATTGGTLSAGTYGYAYTAYNAAGETTASGTATITTTGTTSTITITMGAVAGATGYRVYRMSGPAGAGILNMVTTTTFTDTGAGGGSNSPPTTNTTGQTSSGGQFVTASALDTAQANVQFPAGSLACDGTYALFARVRGFAGDSINFHWGVGPINQDGSLPSGTGSATYWPASSAWTWFYVGEAQLTQAQATGALNVSAGMRTRISTASFLAMDVLALVPTQRSAAAATYLLLDGARDQAAGHLLDTRTVPEVQQR